MKTKVVLVGGRSKTRFLAESLLRKGYRVIVINDSYDDCLMFSEIEKLTVFNGDGTKPFILEDAGVSEADIVIALTSKDEDNLVICELCKKQFHIRKTVAVVSDPKKTEFFYKMGIDSVVCAIASITSIIEQEAFVDRITSIVPIDEGRVSIAKVSITAFAPAVDKKLWELNMPKEAIVGCILRGESTIIPRGDTRILSGDVLVIISTHQQELAAIQELAGW